MLHFVIGNEGNPAELTHKPSLFIKWIDI